MRFQQGLFKVGQIMPGLTWCLYVYPRTSQDMDGALHTDFANFYTTWGSITKISASLQLKIIWILTKFEGCSWKIGPAMPIKRFLRFCWEIQIMNTYDLNILCKAGSHRGWQLVKIWCWYLQPLLRNLRLKILSCQFIPK